MAYVAFYLAYRNRAAGSRNERPLMSDKTALRVSDLAQNTATKFDLRPSSAELQALAAELSVSDLRKLSFSGTVTGQGKRDWRLTGKLGATVVQPCVVTLEPVTTRIETQVQRVYLADMPAPDDAEMEMPEHDNFEKLGAVIDPATVMAEELALAVPQYPRKSDAEFGEAVYSEPGIKPMRDEDARPFAGLGDLRDALKRDS